jgi:hydrogenase nickel incorporation protein HypB
MKIIQVGASITASNDRDADLIRAKMKKEKTLLVNLMSAPGSGKTTFLSRLIKDMPDLKIGVMEADIESAVDAERIEALGAKAIQVHTSGMCHMDAGMTGTALEAIADGEHLDLIFLENVGNLICPAEYDTGAGLNIMILSVPEGDDKPLKYPLMFLKSDALIVSKIDALPCFTFDLDACLRRADDLNPGMPVFPVSAKKGDGMAAFEDWLRGKLAAWTADGGESDHA